VDENAVISYGILQIPLTTASSRYSFFTLVMAEWIEYVLTAIFDNDALV
jgi:hypothetical protein